MSRYLITLLLLSLNVSAFALAPAPAAATSTHEPTLEIGNTKLDVTFTPNISKQQKQFFLDWITQSAQTVSSFYGAFPVAQAGITIIGTSDNGVKTGRALQGTVYPQILVWVGTDTSNNALADDWIMIHEMIHLATATLPRQHRWFEEGLSVYVESMARAQHGRIEATKVWAEFVKRMPNGQLQAGDEGLDITSRWGRTYWGGAIFFLLADIRIRETTGNKLTLADPLKRVISDGLTMNTNATIEEVVEAMDLALPTPILGPLHRLYATQATPFPLDEMWQELGIDTAHASTFDDHARLACIRQAMTSRVDLMC